MSLWQMSFSGAVLIAAILIVRAVAVNRLPKMTFLILWEIAILRLLVPFSISSSVSVYSLLNDSRAAGVLEERIAESGVVASLQGQTTTEDGLSGAADEENTETVTGADVAGISGTVTANAGVAGTINYGTADASADEMLNSATAAGAAASFAVIPVLTLVWFAGVLACAAFFAISYVRSRRKFSFSTPVRNAYTERWLSQHARRRTVSIRQTDFISAPLTYGIVRPVILMPARTNWEDPRHLDYIFAHEYNHIRHYDTLKKLICILVLCIHWFNPFVWVLYFLYNRDIELACDESVIRGFGETSRREYSLMLINMEAKKSGLLPLCNHFSKNSIEERIRAIMKTKKMTVGIIAVSVAIVVVIAALFATSANDDVETSQTTEAGETESAGTDGTLADADASQDEESLETVVSETSGTEMNETENTGAGTEADDAERNADEAASLNVTGLPVSEEENADLYEQVRQLLAQRDYLESEMQGGVAIDLYTTITVDDETYCLVTEEGITSFSDYEALAEEIYTEDYVEQLFMPQYSGYFTEADGRLYRVNMDGVVFPVDEDSICIYQQGGTDVVYIVTANTDTDIIPVEGTTRIFVIQVNETKPYGFEIRDEIELY